MHQDVFGQHAHDDGSFSSEALRKAKNSISRRTKRPVKDSSEEFVLNGRLGNGVTFASKFSSPPQTDSERVYELARLQLVAFFYWLTYNETSKRGHYWPGAFFPVLESVRSDWGNVIHKTFMEAVVGWEPRLLAETAQGFFKAAIRRHPNAACWSWALEWNMNRRIVGFFGEKAPCVEMGKLFPQLPRASIARGHNSEIWYREDVPLNEEDDKLFIRDQQ